MMRLFLISTILCVAAVTAAAAADKTNPTAAPETNAAALEVRADQFFMGSEWAQARDMYKKLAEMVKDDPARLGRIEERIRSCDRNLAKLSKVTPSTAASVAASPPPTGEQRKAHPAPKDGQVLEMTIKDLGNFDYDQEKGGNIPEDVKRLAGQPVRLRGFMIPMDQADNITKFALVPDLFACCFGQPPQIQHMIVANCPEGKAVGYSPDEIVVEGKLNVEEKKDDGYIISIFEVSVSSVKAAPR
jgi:hypothetical protein